MKNFLQLCHFEQKKLFQENYVRIAFLIMTVATIILNLYPITQRNRVAYLDDSGEVVIKEVNYYEEVQLERHFAEQYNGKPLTNEVALSVREFNENYQEYTQTDEGGYIPFMNVRLPYRSLKNLGISPDFELEDPADLAYQHMFEAQKEYVQNLSSEEVKYWELKRKEIAVPFTMYYAQGYYHILDKAYWLNIMGLCFIVLCLCTSFSGEIVCRTDPVVRSSRFGTTKISIAKLMAGESIAALVVLFLFGITAAIQLGIHGANGAEAPIQLQSELDLHLLYRNSSLTTGMAALIVGTTSLLIALFVASITMLLSKLLRWTIPALATPTCVMLLSSTLSNTKSDSVKQVLSYFPFQRLTVGEYLVDGRMVTLFGLSFTATQLSIILYGVLAALLLLLCVVICKITAMDRI